MHLTDALLRCVLDVPCRPPFSGPDPR
jgi:hypothetical protein